MRGFQTGSKLILLAVLLILKLGLATFSGRISLSETQIQATDVIYTFILNFSKTIVKDGKLVIRFPQSFPSFEAAGCEPVSGFSGAELQCAYLATTRMLTLKGAFPTTQNQLQFTVSGITNPQSVQSTASFYVASYDAANVLMETGGTGITITPTPGSIYAQTLTLADPTVGLESTMTLSLEQEHSIPADGQIHLTLPKWNNHDPNPANFQSLISVATNPGDVKCTPISGLQAPITCTMTQDTRIDFLVIQLAELNTVPPQTRIELTIQGVRAPPSQQPLTGFLLKSTDASGAMLDQVFDSTAIVLQATQPVQQSQSSAQVSANPSTVSSVSTVTLTIQNMNPLLAGASFQVTIPAEFGMPASGVTVSAVGDQLNPAPTVTVSQSERTILLENFNLAYLDSFSFSYFYITGLTNPGQTGASSSFLLTFFDSKMAEVEYINQGVVFEASINDFVSQSLIVLNPAIAQQNVGYRFVIQPRGSFTSDAKLKITFPSQLWVKGTASLDSVSSNMRVNSRITILYNHVVILENAFPQGYRAGDQITFTLVGVTNPETTAKTGGITLKFYYTEYKNEISAYLGDELTFQAEPSSQLSISVELSAEETGKNNENLTIIGEVPRTMPIAKGAYVKVTIPGQFTVTDPERVAASCTALTGFSDELICYFESVHKRQGAVLIAQYGFQSKTFSGGSFSFSLSQILNPFTTETTRPWRMEIYDSQGELLYMPNSDNTTSYVRASDFSFAFVESRSPKNGESSLYDFSLTLSVDTPVGSTLSIALPDQIVFDESQDFFCQGTMGFAEEMQCYFRNGKVFWITLLTENTFESVIANGTTLEFTIGHFINPVSLQPSDSFRVSSFQFQYGGGTGYNYINSNTKDLKIQNTERGGITINEIVQVGSAELSADTQILFNISTSTPIPAGSVCTIILPPNLEMTGPVSIKVNQVPAGGATMSEATHKVTVPIYYDLQTEFEVAIVSGLKNPSAAPYDYSSFVIEFQTANGWGIDYVRTTEPWITVVCNNECDYCEGSLENCLACGPDTKTGQRFYLSGSECVEECPPGFYGGFGYVCEPCTAPCTECVFAADLCTACDQTSNTPYSNQATLSCTESCPSGTYLDTETLECMECLSPCYTCASPAQCLTCDSSDPGNVFQFYYEPLQKCMETCPQNSLPSPSNVCIDCESPCLECSEMPDKCVACQEGTYLFKNLCVEKCPFQYYPDEATWTCLSVAKLDIPMPFSISMCVITVGVGIMSCMKHSGQGSTAFWVTNLAICDILLRINWFIMGILALSLDQVNTFFGCCFLLFTSLLINLLLWRRFFKYKYNMDENDRAFVTYCQNYPKTSNWILFMSYMVTFQAVRLSYSRLLGKKMFMASFTRQKRYYRLVGQLSIIEVFFVLCPAILLMVYSIGYEFERGQQLFYIGVDSLFLVTYALVFIIVTLSQREKVMEPRELFQWTEICRCWVDSDEEAMYDADSDDAVAPGSRNKNKVKPMAVMDSDYAARQKTAKKKVQQLETMSATDLDELNTKRLYQMEARVVLPNVATGQKDYGPTQADYNQLKRLEEKLNRVQLKTKLYQNRRDADHSRVQELSEALSLKAQDHDQYKLAIQQLQDELSELQRQIVEETAKRETQVRQAIELRKDSLALRSVSTIKHHQFTLNSIKSQDSNLFQLEAQQQSSPRPFHLRTPDRNVATSRNASPTPYQLLNPSLEKQIQDILSHSNESDSDDLGQNAIVTTDAFFQGNDNRQSFGQF